MKIEASPLYHHDTKWKMCYHATLLFLLTVCVSVCLAQCPLGHVVGGRAECWRDLKREKFYESVRGLFL